MTSRRGSLRTSPTDQNSNSDSVPNSVARRTRSMGSSFSSSRRSASGNNNERTTVYQSRYSRRLNSLNPLRNRSSSTANAAPMRETTEPATVRRSARIRMRLSEQIHSSVLPPPVHFSAASSNLVLASRPASSLASPVPSSYTATASSSAMQTSSPVPSASSMPTSGSTDSVASTPYSDSMESSDDVVITALRPPPLQTVELVRVVPRRLVSPDIEEAPRPPSRTRPASRGSVLFQRAFRLLREHEGSEQPSTSDANPDGPSRAVPPTVPRRQFREITFRHSDRATTPDTTPTNTDDNALRATFFQHAENEALSGMLNSTSVTVNERLTRLRLLRFQEDDFTTNDGLITGLLHRRRSRATPDHPTPTTDAPTINPTPDSPLPARLSMFEIAGQGAIFMEDVRPDTSLRMSLVQAQYLQEVLLRISSLLDNLHILSQMHDRIEDDPRLRTVLAFATLDPDNMTYEQLLMLDELLPKNQGATKELIATKTSLLQYTKSDIHENDICIICITDLEEHDGIRLLPCCHIYHINCIDTWLKRKKTCPMCRSSIEDKPTTVYLERMEKFRDFKK